LNLLRYFFLKTQTAFVPFGFSGLSQRTELVATTSIQKQSGFTVALSTPVTDAVMAAKAVLSAPNPHRLIFKSNDF
jgi:hypothetical protein